MHQEGSRLPWGPAPLALFDGARSLRPLIGPGRCSRASFQPDRSGAGTGQPCSAPTLLFPAARVACGGAARGGPGWHPSASQRVRNRKAGQVGAPAGQNGSKTSSKRACPKKSSVCEKRSLSGFASGRATYL
jgi:hypothetical protein